MIYEPEILAIVTAFAVLANRFVELAITPLFDHYGWNKFPLMYIAWVVTAAIVGLTGVNLFASVIPDPIVGQVLTAIVSGGGANLLHDLVDKP